MYIKKEKNGHGFYTTEIHGEQIKDDKSYKKISDKFYNFLIENSGLYEVDFTKDLTIENLIKKEVVEPAKTITQEERLKALEDSMLSMLF